MSGTIFSQMYKNSPYTMIGLNCCLNAAVRLIHRCLARFSLGFFSNYNAHVYDHNKPKQTNSYNLLDFIVKKPFPS